MQTIVPVQAPDSRDLWHPRDLVFDGLLHLYDGTFDPYLATIDPASGSWSYATHPGWSTVNNGSYGGIASSGSKIFVTDMTTAFRPSSGVVVFDTAEGTSREFAAGIQATDLNMGLDGKLWVLPQSQVFTGVPSTAYAYDPDSVAPLGSVSLAAAGATTFARWRSRLPGIYTSRHGTGSSPTSHATEASSRRFPSASV